MFSHLPSRRLRAYTTSFKVAMSASNCRRAELVKIETLYQIGPIFILIILYIVIEYVLECIKKHNY
jgi:hypothetical protein